MRLLDKFGERRLAHERSLVEQGHDHERKLWLRTLVIFVVGMSAVLTEDWLPSPFMLVANLVVGWMVGQGVFLGAARAHAYRTGWLDGRRRMVQQMQAHQERGSTPHEWLETELAFDTVNVLGLPPLPPQGRPHD
jgi:hypothetical protein